MNTTSLKHIIRAILILLLQVLVLKRIGLSTSWLWQYGDIFLYPVIVFLLPFRISRHYAILIGFVILFDGSQLGHDLHCVFAAHPYIFIFHGRDIHLCLHRSDPFKDADHPYIVHAGGDGISFTLQSKVMINEPRQTARTLWIQRVIIFAALVLIIQTGWLQLVDPTYGQKADRTTLVRRTLYPGR